MRIFFPRMAFLGASGIFRKKLHFDDWQAHFSMQTMIIIRFRRKSRLGQLTYFDPTLGHNGPGMQARYKESSPLAAALRSSTSRLYSHECWDLGHTNPTLYSQEFSKFTHSSPLKKVVWLRIHHAQFLGMLISLVFLKRSSALHDNDHRASEPHEKMYR